MLHEHKELLKAAGLSPELVDKAEAHGLGFADILKLIIDNAPLAVQVLQDIMKLFPAKPA